MVWASEHAEGRGFDSRAGKFPDFSVGIFALRESINVVLV